MFLDIAGVITTSKLSILSTFQGGGCFSPPMSSRVKHESRKVQFIFILHTYSDCLREMHHEMMKSNELTDVTLVCDDKSQFKA